MRYRVKAFQKGCQSIQNQLVDIVVQDRNEQPQKGEGVHRDGEGALR